MTKLTDVPVSDTRRLYDFSKQYDVYGKWLRDNNLCIQDLPVKCKTASGDTVILDGYFDEDSSNIIYVITDVKNKSKQQFYLSSYYVVEIVPVERRK